MLLDADDLDNENNNGTLVKHSISVLDMALI